MILRGSAVLNSSAPLHFDSNGGLGFETTIPNYDYLQNKYLTAMDFPVSLISSHPAEHNIAVYGIKPPAGLIDGIWFLWYGSIVYQGTANSQAFAAGHASLPKLASHQPTSFDAAILVLTRVDLQSTIQEKANPEV